MKDASAPKSSWYDDSAPIAWFFQNLFKARFSQADVLTLAGEQLTQATLQNWANRKYVEPKLVRGKRRYTAIEVAQITMAQAMIKNLHMAPMEAVLAILTATTVFQRKLKSKEFSLEEASHLLCV